MARMRVVGQENGKLVQEVLLSLAACLAVQGVGQNRTRLGEGNRFISAGPDSLRAGCQVPCCVSLLKGKSPDPLAKVLPAAGGSLGECPPAPQAGSLTISGLKSRF